MRTRFSELNKLILNGNEEMKEIWKEIWNGGARKYSWIPISQENGDYLHCCTCIASKYLLICLMNITDTRSLN